MARFVAGDSRQCVNITITPDTEDETISETMTVTISFLYDVTGVTESTMSTTTVRICKWVQGISNRVLPLIKV